MSDPDDYESLPEKAPFHLHMTAGALAGFLEHTCMYPFDSVKTRQQSVCVECPERVGRTPIHSVLNWVRREGFAAPWRGMSAVALGSIPAHAFYFAFYELVKDSKILRTLDSSSRFGFVGSAGIAGIFATVAHDAVMVPTDMVKQRMQMCSSPYKSIYECVGCVYKQEGAAAFYRSYPTQLVMNIPFHTVHFMVYESAQRVFNKEKRYKPWTHVVSGGIAGAIAAAVTTPLDVCKTVLNTQEHLYQQNLPPKSSNLLTYNYISVRHKHSSATVVVRGLPDAIRNVYRMRGIRGFFNGLQARVAFQAPGVAIAWLVYESFKYLFTPDAKNDKHGVATLLT